MNTQSVSVIGLTNLPSATMTTVQLEENVQDHLVRAGGFARRTVEETWAAARGLAILQPRYKDTGVWTKYVTEVLKISMTQASYLVRIGKVFTDIADVRGRTLTDLKIAVGIIPLRVLEEKELEPGL